MHMYLIGLDEAGYGPTLGPLCHGVSAFYLADREVPPDLWELFSANISRHPAPENKLCVDDSKKVYAGSEDLSVLFQSVRHFLGCSSDGAHELKTEEALLAQLLHGDDRGEVEADPWGARTAETQSIELAMIALKEFLATHKAQCVFVRSAACPARTFNRWLSENPTGNKADLSWSRAQCLLHAAWQALETHAEKHSAQSAPVFVYVDRQGGRKFYAGPLSQVFDGSFIEVVEEREARSAYRTEFRSRRVSIEFLVGGDSCAFPIALAALSAKFTREVLMRRFNAYFASQIPAIKPTAGYPTDARRFLKDSASFRKKQKIADADLIRRK